MSDAETPTDAEDPDARQAHVRVDRLDWLVAHEQIRQLASRYAIALDDRDLDTLVSLFVDDVRVGREGVGRDVLRANFEAQLAPLDATILQVSNHLIDVAGADHATGLVSCRGEIERGGARYLQSIRYHDTYERRGGHWLFARRRHVLLYERECREWR